MNKLLYILAFIGTYLSPIYGSMVAVGVMIIIDWVLGIVAAHRIKEKITSKRMSDTLVKMLVYYLLIIAAFIVGKELVTFIPFISITLGFIGVVEFLSIGEKFTKITGLPFLKYIKSIISKQFKNDEIRSMVIDEGLADDINDDLKKTKKK